MDKQPKASARTVTTLPRVPRVIFHTTMRSLALTRLRATLSPLAQAAGLRLVVLFGSAARGESGRAPEDLDLGVLPMGPFDPVAFTNAAIQRLRSQAVDVTDLRYADPLLLMLVARDGVPVYEAPSGEFARFASLAARRFADTRKFRAAVREEVADFVANRPVP